MTDQELLLFSQFVAERTGIQLDGSKRYLFEGRLAEVLGPFQCETYSQLYAIVKKGDKGAERRIIDAISTNETFFFRDPKTFDLLKLKLIPDFLGTDVNKPLSIWSAASSTGQESYSLAIALKEIVFDLSKCRTRIQGTDISEAAVNAANRGEFTAFEVSRGLTPVQIAKSFVPAGDRYRVSDELRSICQFRVDNLLRPTTGGSFDIILCRNVLIYFSPEDRSKVVSQLLDRLKPDGVFIVGATESLLGLTNRLRRLEFHGASYYTFVRGSPNTDGKRL